MNQTYPKFWNSVNLVLLWVLIMFPIYILINYFLKNEMATLALTNTLSISLILFYGFRKTKNSFENVFPLKVFNYKLIFPIILIGFGGSILLSEIDNIFRSLVSVPDFFYTMLEGIFNSKSIILSFILLSIVAPFTEEFLVRGLFLSGFLRNYSPMKAVLFSAFIFAIMHLNPLQFCSTFLFGVFAAWSMIQFNNLWIPLFAHAFMNFIPWFLSQINFVKIKGYNDMDSLEALKAVNVLQPFWFDCLGIILVLFGFYLLNFIHPITKLNKDTEVVEESLFIYSLHLFYSHRFLIWLYFHNRRFSQRI